MVLVVAEVGRVVVAADVVGVVGVVVVVAIAAADGVAAVAADAGGKQELVGPEG